MTCDRGGLLLADRAPKPPMIWGKGWLHGPVWSLWHIWFLLNPDMLAVSTWSLTINQQPLQRSRVFQMTSFLKLPLKWSDSWERAGAEDHVTQSCQMAPTLVFPRWENLHDGTACKGHVALTSVCLVDCQGIASCRRGWEDMLSLPYYSV